MSQSLPLPPDTNRPACETFRIIHHLHFAIDLGVSVAQDHGDGLGGALLRSKYVRNLAVMPVESASTLSTYLRRSHTNSAQEPENTEMFARLPNRRVKPALRNENLTTIQRLKQGREGGSTARTRRRSRHCRRPRTAPSLWWRRPASLPLR